MIPVLVLGLPVFDTSLVIFSRLRRRLNPFTTPGKDHTSHRLSRLGLKNKGAVVALYALSAGLGAVGMAIQFLPPAAAYASFGVAVVLGAVAIGWLERTPALNRDEARSQHLEQV